jgi:hypothetical protein
LRKFKVVLYVLSELDECQSDVDACELEVADEPE